jgi:Mrp family chromosome partitioning ATPase
MAQSQQPQSNEIPDLSEHLRADVRCLGVFSGKGGVGKSLVTGLLATAFAEKGHSVGILDADLTGPSIPRMFGVRRATAADGDRLAPARTERLGIQIMSLNLLMEREDDPVIWRGPLVSKTLEQLITDVDWSGSRYLFVDLPPGTSDVPLTVMQRLPLKGMIVVSSPQELVGMIVRKAIKMAAIMHVPVLGLLENMTHVVCPDCGRRIDLFGPERGDRVAGAVGVPVLAGIPVDPRLAALCDTGEIESYGENPLAGIVDRLAASLDGDRSTPPSGSPQ